MDKTVLLLCRSPGGRVSRPERGHRGGVKEPFDRLRVNSATDTCYAQDKAQGDIHSTILYSSAPGKP
jgi:hypothetical protein